MDTADIVGLAIPVVATMVNVASQITFHRFSARIGFMKSILLGFIVGYGCMLLLELWRFSAFGGETIDIVFLWLGDSALHLCAGYLFFNFVNIGEASIRIRILREVEQATAPMTEAELLSRYNDGEILKARLARLARNGKIAERNGRIFLTAPDLLQMARVLLFFKGLLLRKRSEFE